MRGPKGLQDPESLQLSLGEHLAELRARFVWAMLAFAGGAALGLAFSRQLLNLLLQPVGTTFFYAPAEAFAAHLRVAFIAAGPISWPVVLYQLFSFVAPGLYPSERRFLIWLLPAGTLLFVVGVLFGYLMMLPLVLMWLSRFASSSLTPAIDIAMYTAFALRTMVPFGLIFQLPLLVGVLGRAGVVTARGLAGARRPVILAAVAAAALLTPPDVVSQLLMAGPIVVLYEISVIIARFAGSRRDQS